MPQRSISEGQYSPYYRVQYVVNLRTKCCQSTTKWSVSWHLLTQTQLLTVTAVRQLTILQSFTMHARVWPYRYDCIIESVSNLLLPVDLGQVTDRKTGMQSAIKYLYFYNVSFLTVFKLLQYQILECPNIVCSLEMVFSESIINYLKWSLNDGGEISTDVGGGNCNYANSVSAVTERIELYNSQSFIGIYPSIFKLEFNEKKVFD